MENADVWMNKGIDFVTDYGPKILGAIAIYIIGSWIIKKLVGSVRKVLNKGSYDESLQRFLLNFLSWGLRIFLIIMVISKLGVETTSFAAILAAAGLAV